jgi:CCR4-NOT transcription complex subunit 2
VSQWATSPRGGKPPPSSLPWAARGSAAAWLLGLAVKTRGKVLVGGGSPGLARVHLVDAVLACSSKRIASFTNWAGSMDPRDQAGNAILAMVQGGSGPGRPPTAGRGTAPAFPSLGGASPATRAVSGGGAPTATGGAYPSLGQAIRGVGSPPMSGAKGRSVSGPAFPSLAGLGGAPSGPARSTESGMDLSTIAPKMPGAPVAGQSAASRVPGAPVGAVDLGLTGLMDLLRKEDKLLSEMALGHDLTQIGLDIKVPRVVATLGLPYADAPVAKIPVLDMPASFRVHAPPLREGHLLKLELPTLLLAFYAMPRDAMQAAAAKELYRRGWRLHRDTKLWVRPSSTEGKHEKLAVFDVQSWEIRPFDQIPEQEVLKAVVPVEDIDATYLAAVRTVSTTLGGYPASRETASASTSA